MKIYTKAGDGGETSIPGGKRVRKDSDRVTACGTLDELNASLGMAVTVCTDAALRNDITNIQHELFTAGADLAAPGGEQDSAGVRVTAEFVTRLESEIDRYEQSLETLTTFIFPGGCSCAAALHLARAVCRRAERAAFALARSEEVNRHVLIYLNRLSDLLFVFARYANMREGKQDIPWIAGKKQKKP